MLGVGDPFYPVVASLSINN